MKLSHPFIAELKRYVANQNATLGPIVLNLCNVIKFNRLGQPSANRQDEEIIVQKQRKLSQVTDMIHAAHVFHRCVRDNNNNKQQQQTSEAHETSISKSKRLHQDNVMSLLVGDYLLAQSSVDMADLRYPRTVGLIAKGLEDYTSGEFLKLQLVDRFQKDTRNKQHLNAIQICNEINRYAELTCGSLLSNACLSAALLAGYSETSNDTNHNNSNNNNHNLANLVYSFGFHTGSAHRLIEMLYCPDTNSEDDRNFIKALDVKSLDESIRAHLDRSVELLYELPDGERRPALLEMLNKMKSRCLSSSSSSTSSLP